MKNALANWEGAIMTKVTREVFRRQVRIRDAAKRGDIRTLQEEQHKLLTSFNARILAVRQVAAMSKGRHTAGPDGVSSPSKKEMFQMAQDLTIGHQPSPVRRHFIPKPGKKEKRPLGIPNLIDRAHQALLALAIEPEWEARFSAHMYGFRRGRNQHDAVKSIQSFLKCTPCYVLDADIEKFFDRLNHTELLKKLNLPLHIDRAVRRVLKAGVLADGIVEPTDLGTPQGSPLSPLLANAAMSGIEEELETAFKAAFRGKVTQMGRPRIVIWADDLIIMHKDLTVVQWCQEFVEGFLQSWGLNLSREKTSIRHTQQEHETRLPGFDFLGFHFQHVWSNKPKKGGQRDPFLLVKPSKENVRNLLDVVQERLKKCLLSRKRRAARQQAQRIGKADPVTKMIKALNRRIEGWTRYYCYVHSTTTFSALDNHIHLMLWAWAKRRFPKRTVEWIKERLFSGKCVRYRKDGRKRNVQWVFMSPFMSNEGKHETLTRAAHAGSLRYTSVRSEKSFFDGDWAYWGARSERYPGTPRRINRTALKRQKGKCAVCKGPLVRGESLNQRVNGLKGEILHERCSSLAVPAIGHRADHAGDLV